MIKKNNFIDKDITNFLKGVALIFMFIHHFFTFPNWINTITYPHYYTYFQNMTKICVAIFSFLTGYFYYYCKNKTLKYSLKKACLILEKYVIIFIPIYIIILFLHLYDFSFKTFVYNIFGLNTDIMCFCAYIPYYCISLFIIYLFSKVMDKTPFYINLLLCFIPKIIILLLITKTTIIKHPMSFLEYFDYFPSIGFGYITAKYQLFIKLDSIISNKHIYINMLINGLLIIVSLLLMNQIYLNFISSLLIVFALTRIYYQTKSKFIFHSLSIIGKHSISMWFIHCIFFNQLKIYTQPILYFFKIPIIVLIEGLIITLVISKTIEIIIDFNNKKLKMIKSSI